MELMRSAKRTVTAPRDAVNFSESMREMTKIDAARMAMAVAIFLSVSALRLCWKDLRQPVTPSKISFRFSVSVPRSLKEDLKPPTNFLIASRMLANRPPLMMSKVLSKSVFPKASARPEAMAPQALTIPPPIVFIAFQIAPNTVVDGFCPVYV